MKRVALLFVFCFLLLSACSSSRKVVNETTVATAQTQITATQEQEQEKKTGVKTETAAAISSQIRDLSKVVIEFTKVEYNDGSEEITADTCAQQAGAVTARYREGESKPPNTGKGVKAVTTGRVTIDNDRTEAVKEETLKNSILMDYQRGIFKGTLKEEQESESKTKTKSEATTITPKLRFVICILILLLLAVFAAFVLIRLRRKFEM